MKIAKEELLDKLRRASEMEEVMAGVLTDLVSPHVLMSEVSEEKRQKIRSLIAVIHADTLEHQKIVLGLLKNLSEN
ncbi:MAG: hypothetical protein A2351_04075 [Omnitrophica bacterium RIFOXYB12_FULL_50_7]|nr:MAG: hypothetical protein A2351_04075 [Omnitrophica bacterium RIFOXYB12_FULL_50_7]